MSELAERSRLLISRLVKGILDAENTVEYCDLDSALGLSFAMPLIEQALLAERRLAMEEAEKIVNTVELPGVLNSQRARWCFREALRSTAEREVSNG